MLTSTSKADDLLTQSIPFAYMDVSVASNDGSAHEVQVYSDISGEWASGDLALTATWSTNTEGDVLVHQVQLESPDTSAEVNDHTQCTFFRASRSGFVLIYPVHRWIRLLCCAFRSMFTQSLSHSTIHLTRYQDTNTYPSGADIAVRAQFINNCALTNDQDTNFRAIQDNWPVLASHTILVAPAMAL